MMQSHTEGTFLNVCGNSMVTFGTKSGSIFRKPSLKATHCDKIPLFKKLSLFVLLAMMEQCQQEMHINECLSKKGSMPKLIVKGKASPFFQLISLKGQWTKQAHAFVSHSTVSSTSFSSAKKLWASFFIVGTPPRLGSSISLWSKGLLSLSGIEFLTLWKWHLFWHLGSQGKFRAIGTKKGLPCRTHFLCTKRFRKPVSSSPETSKEASFFWGFQFITSSGIWGKPLAFECLDFDR